MNNYKYRKPNLTRRRDNAIMMHVVRSFATLHPVVHRLFFDGVSEDMSRKVLKRLTGRGYLSKFPIWENKSYYRLGPTAVREWGYPRTRHVPLGPQRLPYELGTLAYTSMDTIIRKRLLPHELKRRCAWFADSLMQWAYVWESGRLGSIRVEPRCGRPDRVIQKLAEQVYRYSAVDEFRSLVDCDEFFLVVVVASEAQEHAIQTEAREQKFPVELRTSHYPELVRFI